MAVPFLHNIDLNQNELLNAKVHTDSDSAKPSNPGTGSIWFDTDTNLLKIYRGGSWDNLFVKTEAITDGGTNLATADHIHTFVTAGSLTLTNKTIDADNNTISNIEVDNFASGVLDTDISSVAGTDTTLASAKAIKTYVDAQVTVQDLDFSGDSGTGAVDLDSQTFAITGATGITTTASGQGLSIDLDDTASDMTATNSGVYGSATAIPVITVDRQGRLTAATTAAISTTLTVDGDSGSEDLALASDDLQILGTTGEIDVAVTKVSTDVKATIGLADTITGNRTFANNVTISGNLTINGTTTDVDTTNLVVEDPLIKLAKNNNASDSLDIGFYGLYDTSGSQDLFAGLFRDAGDGKFKLFKDLQAEPTTTVNTSGTGYAVATLVANIEGNVTGNASTATQAANLNNHDTDDLSEGSSNLYYTDARADARIDARSSAHTITGDNSAKEFTISYGFTAAAINDVMIQVVDSSGTGDGDTVFTEVERHSTTQCKIKFNVEPPTGKTYRVLCFKIA